MKDYPYFKAQLTTAISLFLVSFIYLKFIHEKITDALTADLFAMSVIAYLLAPVAIIGILSVKAYFYFRHERNN